jgi:hypothetical protein
MKKKILIICIGLLAMASATQATPVQFISVTTVDTMFVPVSGGILVMSGTSGINVMDTSSNTTTYVNGSFSLFTTLASDTSSGGIAKGNFAGGSFSYNDSSNNPLLSGNIVSLNLVEVFNGTGMLTGLGQFTVTGGSLQGNFGAAGQMFASSFSVPPNISNFSTGFNRASSNMTIQPTSIPVPEPATIALLIPAILAFRNKRNSK